MKVFVAMSNSSSETSLVAKLEERQLLLTANYHNRTPLEEAELKRQLSRLETRYNTLVTALANHPAQTQGTFNL